MDYVLHVVQRWGDEPVEDVAARARAGEEQAPDPAGIRRMAGVLQSALPSLVKADVPKGWSLTHPGSGARISMQGDEFRIVVPRTHAAATARSVWSGLWPVLRTLTSEGYAAYDAQLDRVLDVATDLDAVVKEYSGAAELVAAPPAPSRPWWKIW
jgi:hypothetical protein